MSELIYGYDVTYVTHDGLTLDCHYVGSEKDARRKTLLRSKARAITRIRPMSKREYERAFGYRGRM